jgi:hypothetical protein
MKQRLIFLFVVFVCINKSEGQFTYGDSTISEDLKQKFLASKFSVTYNNGYLDSTYLNFQKQERGHNCVGNPNDHWKNTDAPQGNWCTARMKFYGRSTNNKSLRICLFQQNLGGGLSYTFDIFEIEGGRLNRLVSFWLPMRINTVAKIKQEMRLRKFWAQESYKKID